MEIYKDYVVNVSNESCFVNKDKILNEIILDISYPANWLVL